MRLPASVLRGRDREVKAAEHLALLDDDMVVREAIRLAGLFLRANGGAREGSRTVYVARLLRELANRLCLESGGLVILDGGEVFFGKDPIQ
jgi:hypothetical protein